MSEEILSLYIAKLRMKIMSREFSAFDCDGIITGIVHVPDEGDFTVILDGGYILGEFDCTNCVIKAIATLYANILQSDKNIGMDYKAYKKVYSSATSSAKFH